MENCPLLADTQYWYSVERRCYGGERRGIRDWTRIWLRSDQLLSRDWVSSSMTDHPEIGRQLGIAFLPPSLISPAWGLNLPYIDNIAVLLLILINGTFYGVSICCRVSNIFSTICYHYLWLVFDIPIIARIYPSLTSTSFLPSPVLYQWMGGAGGTGGCSENVIEIQPFYLEGSISNSAFFRSAWQVKTVSVIN